MFDSLVLKNFQSHKRTRLSFHQGVNVIVGSSDSGKSAILRALGWVTFNKPAGEAFRSHWGGETEATVQIGGTVVSRIRGDRENKYELQKDGDKTVFKAIGSEVPALISKILDLDAVNFQSQMDAPFLLSDSPGEVAQFLNRVTNLEVIDSSISNARKMALEVSRAIKVEEQIIGDKTVDLKKYDRLDDWQHAIDFVKDCEKIEERLAKRNSTLSDTISKLEAVERIEKEGDWVASADDRRSELSQTMYWYDETAVRITSLSDLILELTECDKALERESEITRMQGTVVTLTAWIADATTKTWKSKELQTSIMYIENMESDIVKYKRNLEQDEEKFKALMPLRCPLCGK